MPSNKHNCEFQQKETACSQEHYGAIVWEFQGKSDQWLLLSLQKIDVEW